MNNNIYIENKKEIFKIFENFGYTADICTNIWEKENNIDKEQYKADRKYFDKIINAYEMHDVLTQKDFFDCDEVHQEILDEIAN